MAILVKYKYTLTGIRLKKFIFRKGDIFVALSVFFQNMYELYINEVYLAEF